MTIIFGLLLWGFFAVSFTSGGVIFNAYAQSVVNVSDIANVGNVSVVGLSLIPTLTHEGLNQITVGGKNYYAPQEILTAEILEANEQIVVFDDAPALRENVVGAITSIDGKQIRSQEELSSVLSTVVPGEPVIITTIDKEKTVHSYEIALLERNGRAYLGIGFYAQNTKGFRGLMSSTISKIKSPNTYYVSTWDGDFAQFIYDLLWWIVIINILVALMNMLPVAILDGGRFFYLTIWGITRSQKWGRKIYAWVTWFILLLLVLMMAKWFLNLF